MNTSCKLDELREYLGKKEFIASELEKIDKVRAGLAKTKDEPTEVWLEHHITMLHEYLYGKKVAELERRLEALEKEGIR